MAEIPNTNPAPQVDVQERVAMALERIAAALERGSTGSSPSPVVKQPHPRR